ncbi:hypothetical protein MTO96_051274 [Rhipicephalus appendiculatus]
MKAYLILALLVFGYLCQIHAATLDKPEVKTHAMRKLADEEFFQSLAKEQEDVIEALKSFKDVGEDNKAGYFIYQLASIIRAIVAGFTRARLETAPGRCSWL